MSTNNFSGWSEKDLRRWLRENHPKPPTKDRWVQFTLHIRYVGCALELTIADDYEICIAELALGMRIMSASDPSSKRWNIIVRGAKRRKKKQSTLHNRAQWLRSRRAQI